MSDNEDSVELAKTSQVHVDAEEDTDQETSHHFKSFKEYKDRKCVDWLCCFLLTMAFIGWVAILVISAINGNPQVLYRATDYRKHMRQLFVNQWIRKARPMRKNKGNFPTNLDKAKYGVMPRLVDDFVAQLSRTSKT